MPPPTPDEPTADWLRAELAKLYPDWHSPIDLGHGVVTKPRAQRRFARRLRLLQIPGNLTGKRVLDVGTWDGFFATELERRGAEVVAIDIWDDNAFQQFQFVLKVKNSRITYKRMDVHDVSPDALGKFDLVLCAGVLYHCRYPLIALEKLRAVTQGMLILETVTMIPATHGSAPMIMFFPGDQEAIARESRDPKFSWGIAGAPTLPWIYEALRSAGFDRIEHKYTPSMLWWKKLVAFLTNTPGSGRSVTHAYAS